MLRCYVIVYMLVFFCIFHKFNKNLGTFCVSIRLILKCLQILFKFLWKHLDWKIEYGTSSQRHSKGEMNVESGWLNNIRKSDCFGAKHSEIRVGWKLLHNTTLWGSRGLKRRAKSDIYHIKHHPLLNKNTPKKRHKVFSNGYFAKNKTINTEYFYGTFAVIPSWKSKTLDFPTFHKFPFIFSLKSVILAPNHIKVVSDWSDHWSKKGEKVWGSGSFCLPNYPYGKNFVLKRHFWKF